MFKTRLLLGDNSGRIDLHLGNPVSSPGFDLAIRCKHETYLWVRPIVVSLDVIKVGGGLESVVMPDSKILVLNILELFIFPLFPLKMLKNA
jgi:hypothetical protein